MPEDSICHGTIFLVYQGNAQGHYDAALPSKQKDTITTLTDSVAMEITDIKCSCGKNSKEYVLSCVHRPLNASRCKRYKNGIPCSIMCKCKNPHGQRLKANQQERN